jgi:prolyl oligopeptidase
VTLIVLRGTPRDGSAPALLTGYSGYGTSLKSRFDPDWLPRLEAGRSARGRTHKGGGEYGQDWNWIPTVPRTWASTGPVNDPQLS